MSPKKDIAVLTCYIGKLPWYFDFYIHSCKFNPSIDFIVVTDDVGYSKPIPSNVTVVNTTLEEINETASRKLGFKTNIRVGYKLCDFKPTYGLLFSELLENYTFWGYSDIDLIYGNIRAFITDEMLETYDIISVRDDYITGCFLLLRNNDKLRNLYTYSKDYRMVLSSDKYCGFDETGFRFKEFGKNIHYSQIDSEIESMMHVVKKLEEQGLLKIYFDFHVIEGSYGKLSWNKGKLIFKNKYEAVLYHLIKFKQVYKPKVNHRMVPDSFRISQSRIYT